MYMLQMPVACQPSWHHSLASENVGCSDQSRDVRPSGSLIFLVIATSDAYAGKFTSSKSAYKRIVARYSDGEVHLNKEQ